RDAVHYARLFPGQTAADGLLILILIYTGCVVLASIVGGVISDRRGRRKMLVTVSGLLMAAAALLLTFVETWDAALLAAVLFGLGYGAYIAVDQALITQVLPAARDRAKDLGIINIAIVCPGAIGAVIAAPLVSLAGYPALFGAIPISPRTRRLIASTRLRSPASSSEVSCLCRRTTSPPMSTVSTEWPVEP